MSKQIQLFLCLIMVLCFLVACDDQEVQNQTGFHKLSSSQTGISFANNLSENDSLNYFTYSYIYMGGGVSVGDINNDGLDDLFFTGNMVPNKLYLNKGNLQFEDISDVAGVSGDSRWYTGTTMTDINGDGFLDIYCSVGGRFGPKENQLFVNNGDNSFTEQAEMYGIADPSNSVQATFLDYDLDGDLDLYVANYPPTSFNAPNQYYALKQRFPKPFETDRLYRNDGDSFAEVTEESGIRNFGLSLSATVGDINNDGWPDIYISNDFSTPDYLYINNQDGTFTDRVRQTTKNVSFYGMGVDIADFNNDQLLDILQVDMTAQINRRSKANMASMNPELFWSTVNSGFHYQYMQNSLQLNNGNMNGGLPDFSNISRIAGVSSTDWSWGPLFVDLDNDGLKDIFISNGTRREINNRDFFKKIDKTGVPKDSMLQKTLEMPSEKIDNFAFRNKGDLSFEKMNTSWGLEDPSFANGSVYADLDNDGDMDIITNNIDDVASVFENKMSANTHYITIRMKGSETNPFGVGMKASLYSGDQVQYQELTMTRGFQSSVAPLLHFGIGDNTYIDSISLTWPDQRRQTIINPEIDTLLYVNYTDAIPLAGNDDESPSRLFATVPLTESPLQHLHEENYFNDFDNEVLLPHQTSMFGPNIAVGDLDGDQVDDLIVGGSAEKATTVYIQKEGQFIKSSHPALEADHLAEDLGIHIFDVDQDGDNDIYVVSGGNEYGPDSKFLQDRLYINVGGGNFEKSQNGLPTMLTSGSRVSSHDYDRDGDLDLFVGGRLIPGNYPSPANSYILENQSSSEEILFKNVTAEVAPSLSAIGMVTDGIWTDYNQDGWSDLIVVGEWMGIHVLQNNRGVFEDISAKVGLGDTRGWWFSIAQGDFDDDNDMDYIIGNLGLNYKYKANDTETFDIYFKDFDGNQKKDIVLSYYNEGEKYPLRGRECSSQQIPAIKAKYKDYESFSLATLEDVYTKSELEESLHYQVKSFSSIYIENTEEGFKTHKLPNLAQLSCVNDIMVDDYNGDGNLDAIIAGNLYASEVETPRNDASNGLLLLGDGRGEFEPMRGYASGLHMPGDVKDLAKIIVSGKQHILAAKNSNFLQLVEFEK